MRKQIGCVSVFTCQRRVHGAGSIQVLHWNCWHSETQENRLNTNLQMADTLKADVQLARSPQPGWRQNLMSHL